MAGQQEELTAIESENPSAAAVKLVAEANESGQRLDAFLAQAGGRCPALSPFSRSKLQKMIEAGAVTLNGVVARSKENVRAGDAVEVRLTGFTIASPSTLVPVAMVLNILYEDDTIIVIDKPAGISVHPGAGDTGPTLVQGLLHHVAARGGDLGRAKAFEGGDDDEDDADAGVTDSVPKDATRPGIVHRLDKDTSGVLVVAKTDVAHAHLAKQFHDKTNEREYAALLDGAMPAGEIVCETYLFRDPSNRMRFQSINPEDYEKLAADGGLGQRRFRLAKSVFRREETFGARLTLAAVTLFTGRTHQIRVHATALRLPVVGDQLYHRAVNLPERFSAPVRQAVWQAGRQLLHARSLGFIHPVTGQKVRFTAPYPADFQDILDKLRAKQI